ncbi:tetratricopeptide repeat protein [Ornithinicoccus hortensis]|uniref:Tetratricopeptide repeat protein n=2 Tax=Ornithinicoccus hortensis TaxID=82346 RepID=A0A542YS02_9MICO|nr:tetratricopeptide repeat protein [Ornithinicoccus hortensis]
MMEDVVVLGAMKTPLVGRGDELAQLMALAGVGSDPTPAAVVLGGEAGVGKTRLLHELGHRAEEAGWQVLIGHCLDFGESALSYLPFSEMFGRLGAARPEVLAALTRSTPAITRLQPGQRLLGAQGDEGEPASGTLEQQVIGGRGSDQDGVGLGRGDIFEGTHAALEQLAERAPVLVIVEDAHWADRSTCDILSSLFARGFQHPVSIVVSYRSDDLHRRHPLRARVTEWARMSRVSRVNLSHLPDRDVRTLVRAAHGASRPGQALSEREVQEIVRRAEGNAFFAEELLGAHELDHGDLPADLADLLLVRLDRLDEQARGVVRAAAAAGRRVAHDLLASVGGLSDGALNDALRAAVEANILVPWGDSSYAFRHALLAEAVYDDLLPGERTRLHAAYVSALVGGRGNGSAAELARHARAAQDRETALVASIEAGDDAMKVGGPEEAARHYQTALELLADPALADHADTSVVHLTRRASEALIDAGHPQRAAALLRDSLAAHGPDLADDDRAKLLLVLARAAMFGDDPSVNPLDLTTTALDLVGPDARPLRAHTLAVHARANVDRSRFAEGVTFAQQALTLAEELGLERTAVDAATTLGRLNEVLGDPEESLRVLSDVLEQARAAGDTAAETRALHQLGGTLMEMGRITQARGYYRQSMDLSERRSRPWAPYGADARILSGVAAYMVGDWDEVDLVTDTSHEVPPPLMASLLASIRLQVAAGRGDPSGLATLEATRTEWLADGWLAINVGGAAIDLYGDADRLEEAERAYQDVVSTVTAAWQVPAFQAQVRLSTLLLGQLASAASRLGAGGRADLLRRGDELLTVGEKTAQRRSVVGRDVGPEGRAWGQRMGAEHLRLRWLAGQDVPQQDLRRAWEETVQAFEVLEHPFEVARSQSRLAAVLRAQGEQAAAHELTAAARETAERLGALPLLAELATVDRGATPSSDDQAGPVLTPREREVLALVAEGRTNGQIARQLFISTKTVSVHVSNILAKLGASGRTEAAALARRQGLLD